MPIIEYAGTKVNLDDEGYLVDFDSWNENTALALAGDEGMGALTEAQMGIIKFIREYYREYNFFPILNAVCKNVHQPRNCVQEEFMSPLKAWRIAGLPKPDELIVNLLEFGESPG
ncbi:MAG: TusE/DsrC/DsvC family sulfur relay protein [Nitrospiraceae bacterium]|nr:MAG: TusE/DsrC/DsvC family sulfur relay protein [Nitrospiraceae bacterium]